MQKTTEIKIPTLPNFLFDTKGSQYKISELTEKELRSLGAEWTEALVARAHEARLEGLQDSNKQI